MKRLLLWVLIISFSKIKAQEIEWQQTANWKLYNIHGIKGYNIPVDQILKLKTIDLNNDSVRYFLSGVAKLNSKDQIVWMGHYLASCNTKEGQMKIFYVSVYGGFFYDSNENVYYNVSANTISKWLDYLLRSEIVLENSK